MNRRATQSFTLIKNVIPSIPLSLNFTSPSCIMVVKSNCLQVNRSKLFALLLVTVWSEILKCMMAKISVGAPNPCCQSVSHLCSRAREERFNGNGSARGWKLSLHDGSHKRLHQSWRQSPTSLHLIQHLQHTHAHTRLMTFTPFMPILYGGCQSLWESMLGELIFQ